MDIEIFDAKFLKIGGWQNYDDKNEDCIFCLRAKVMSST